MNSAQPLQALVAKTQPLSNSSPYRLVLQRKCTCGSQTSSLTSECTECKRKKHIQTKLTIGASNDPLEHEADRVADQAMAAPAGRGGPLHIQRYMDRTTDGAGIAPASVDRVLAHSGKPLEAALRQDMEQRFGHDFSRVRVHSGEAAEQSAQEINAKAYTVGQDVVFGAGALAPGSQEGLHLIAHELTHVVQQSSSNDYPQILARSPNLQKGWWSEKVAAIRAAISEAKNFTTYPTGAFWLINPLNDDDRAHIMTLLTQEELESLFVRGAEAMTARIPNAVDMVAKATDELHRRGFVPSTEKVPAEPLPESDDTDWSKDPAYVDNITSAHFDLVSGEFWTTHVNGVSAPLDVTKVLADSDKSETQAEKPGPVIFRYFYRGPGGLIRPTHYSTTLAPNIVFCARQVREALPQAAAMRSIGLTLLEMQETSLEAAIAGKVVGAIGRRIFAKVWRAPIAPGGRAMSGSPTRRIMSDAEAFTQARNARNTMVDAYNKMSKTTRKDFAVVTGGVNIETGQVAGGYNTVGQCAENMVVERLGGDASKIRFSEAVRPRSGQQVKVCLGCQPGKYLKEQFPEGVIFESFAGPPMPKAGQ